MFLVQNYDPVIYVETAFGEGCCMSPNPKFELRIVEEEGGKNLWLAVQNCTKLVQNCDLVSYVETALGVEGCMSLTPQMWIAESARRKSV